MDQSFVSQFMSGMRTQEEKPMKLIIDIHEPPKNDHECWVMSNGTPFDSVIEDIKAELTKDYVDDNPDNFRYTTVMLKDVLAIIDKHIDKESKK